MSDEGLDNLFRNGLSGKNVNFNMDSWRRMEEMLPPESKAGAFKFSYAALIVGLLLVVSTAIFLWGSNDQISNANRQYVSRDNTEVKENNNLNKNSSTNVNLASNKSAVINDEGEDDLSKRYYDKKSDASVMRENKRNGKEEIIGSNSMEVLASAKHMSLKKSKTNALFSQNENSKSGFFGKSNSSNEQVENRGEAQEEILLVTNSFTKIDGIAELSSLDIVNEDDNTIVVDVSNGRRPKVSKNEVGFIGGVNVNKGLVASSENKIYGSAFFGVSYQRYLNGGVSLKANLLYSSINGINSSIVHDKKTYGFGSQTEQVTAECQRLMYMELPVMVNYGVANHNFMVGPSFSYLVGGQNKVTTNYQNETENWSEEESVWGYSNGFKPYDIAIVAGYAYSIKPQLNLGVRLNYGLIDITDNTYFGNDSFDNNVQFRFYLTYSPFNF